MTVTGIRTVATSQDRELSARAYIDAHRQRRHSNAMDLILTGRGVQGEEALRMGIANRLVPHGQALDAAVHLAHELARFPQRCLRSDRLSAYEQWSLPYEEALRNELRRGRDVVESGETATGAAAFARGQGRHGAF